VVNLVKLIYPEVLLMPTKAIKNIDEDAWNTIKSFAAARGMSMGRYFNELAREIKTKSTSSRWEKLLSWKARDRNESVGIEKRIKKFRAGFGLRKFP
jgi:hypothetical protein